MKKPIGMLFASFALAGSLSANALADEQYRSDSTPQTEETVGLMSGAVIGAAAGGPPGAIIGAALGIFVGDGWVTRRDYRDMEAEWVTSKVEAREARQQLASCLERRPGGAAGPRLVPPRRARRPRCARGVQYRAGKRSNGRSLAGAS